jgi:hypothetical protein
LNWKETGNQGENISQKDFQERLRGTREKET